MKRSLLLLTALCTLLVSGIASAQESAAPSHAQSDVAVSVFGSFTNGSTGNFLDRTATESGGGLLSFRYFPSEHNGLEVNYSYTTNSQDFVHQNVNDIPPVQTSVNELTGAWVVAAHYGPFRPFGLVGGGLLIFSPTNNTLYTAIIPINRQARPALLFGAGVDVHLVKQLALRAQCRGLFYAAPDFGSANIDSATGMLTMEPSLGLVYKF